MFNEQVYQGPGQETMQTYVLEIALILLGAFILGYLLRALLNASYKSKIQDLEHQLSKKQVAEAQAEGGMEDLQVQISEQRYKIESLEKKLELVEKEKRELETKYNATLSQVEEKEDKLTELEQKLSTATWPEVDDKVSNETEDHFPESNLIKDKQEQEEPTPSEDSSASDDSPIELEKEDEHANNEEVSSAYASSSEESETEESTSPNLATSDSPEAADNAEVKPDNLRLIEGIGPKIEQLLNNDGIFTFKQLAEADGERIKAILIAEGPTYAVHDPSTWSEQSKLAFEGKWEQLDALQESLKGGKRR